MTPADTHGVGSPSVEERPTAGPNREL